MIIAPKISIVTPSFNACEYINETVKSVLEQDYENFEYYVIDGGSTDGTVEILKQWESRINNPNRFRWISEKDNGQADAINKGLNLCSGDWFAFLNADDYFTPTLFKDVAPILSENSDKGVIYGNQFVKYEGVDESYNLIKKPVKQFSLNDLLYANQVFGPASFYNMNALKTTGPFNSDLYHWMDWDMYLRILKIMPFLYVDYNMTTFRISDGMKSPSNPGNRKKYKKFQKEAHLVSINHGGRYFSEKWLQRFTLYGRYKYYLRRFENEPSVIGHDKIEAAHINSFFMLLVISLHYTLKPVMYCVKKMRRIKKWVKEY